MSSKIKIIIEKGPREGETLEYDPTSVIRIGRVARGNKIAIKDEGISSKHLCIQFDKMLQKWILIDLGSSNGTVLNGMDLKPNESYSLSDGDCIKIGDLTCMIVKIGIEIEVAGLSDRRNGKGVAVVESELGFNEGKAMGDVPQKRNLRGRGRKVAAAEESEKAVEVEVVQKRVLRGRGKQGVDMESEKTVVKEDLQKRDLRGRGKVKIGVENLSCKRVLRSSKMGENVNVDVREMGEGVSVLTESKKTTGGRKKLPVKVVEDSDLDGGKRVENGILVEGKRTGRGRGGGRPRKKMAVESLKENDAIESVQVGEGNEGDSDQGKRTGKITGRGRGRPRKMTVVESLEENDAKESVQVGEASEGGDFDIGEADLMNKDENMGSVANLDAIKEFNGNPNTIRKSREDKLLVWHNTPPITILEKALKRNAAQAWLRVE